MELGKLKKALVSIIATSFTVSLVAGCNSSANAPLQNSIVANDVTQISSVPADVKFGFKLNTKTQNAIFDVTPSNKLKEDKVDLREFCSPVANQGHLGSCTAFAIGKGLNEFLRKRDGRPQADLSPLFLYYAERDMDGDVDEDAGSTITTGIKVLQKIGDSKETSWPYDITKFTQKPPQAAYDEAAGYEISGAKQLSGLTAIKAEIAKKNPVVFGFRVYESFMKSTGGNIPTPDVKHERLLGGHAVMVVGYDEAKQVLIMRNSWGPAWGDQGYFYMPYSYFKLGLVMDAWTATSTTLKTAKR